jgi:hypothetical protein
VAREASRFLTAAVAALGIGALMLNTACYAYELKAPSDLAAGQTVEVVVNNLGRVVLEADLGEDVAKVDGNVVAVTDSTLRMNVTNVAYVNGSSSTYPGSEIAIPRKTITSVSSKQFSRSKTTVVAVGLAAALIAAIGAFGIAGSGAAGSDSKPGGGNGGAQ